jgi:hypothetical protein
MPTTPHDDELASAFLDGEATAAEAARVDADPVLLARVEELRGVREAVSTAVGHVDPARRDAAIAAALAGAQTDELAVVRARRVTSTRWLKIASAAAALALLAGGTSVVAGLGDDDSTELADVDSSIGDDEAAVEDGALYDAATGAPGSSTADAMSVDHPSVADLAATLRSQRAARREAAGADAAGGGEPTSQMAPTQSAACSADGEVGEPIAALQETGTASVAGQPVTYAIFLLADGRTHLVVQDAACVVLFSGEL